MSKRNGLPRSSAMTTKHVLALKSFSLPNVTAFPGLTRSYSCNNTAGFSGLFHWKSHTLQAFSLCDTCYCVEQDSEAFKGNWWLVYIYNSPPRGLKLSAAVCVSVSLSLLMYRKSGVPIGCWNQMLVSGSKFSVICVLEDYPLLVNVGKY